MIVKLRRQNGSVFAHEVGPEDYFLDHEHPWDGPMFAIWSGQYNTQGEPYNFSLFPVLGEFDGEEVKKVRRRVEDALRKTQPINIFKVANVLDIKIN